MKQHMVLGCGFGDEGKGKVVSYLCSNSFSLNKLVVRFSGGQQAGHHVVLKNGSDHVFSNFGSGTLLGVPTYFSKYCTIDPVGILNELDSLKEKNIDPFLFINNKCPVTTPYEKAFNRKRDSELLHGSCGVGVGQTIQRESDHYSILFEDIYYPSVLKIKLNLLKNYYSDLRIEEKELERFWYICDELNSESKNIKIVKSIDDILDEFNFNALIFEGSQGLLLDQNYGFFPHVTRSNTGSKNVIDMGFNPKVWLVTRAYQTRHGNGPMTNENLSHKIKINPYENNPSYNFQGVFRKSILDLDLLKYAINKDSYLQKAEINLVITCMDLLDEFAYTIGGNKIIETSEQGFVERIKHYLNIKNIYVSKNPYPKLEKIE